MANPRSQGPRSPTHRLYRVIGVGKAATWIPIGAAWPTQDGQGFNICCDLVPLQGRIVLRVASLASDHDLPARRS